MRDKEIPDEREHPTPLPRRSGPAKASLQIVGAVSGGNEAELVDIDIDRANPRYDAWRFILHCGHLFGRGKTNHLKLRRNELNRGIAKDYMYYRAVKRR